LIVTKRSPSRSKRGSDISTQGNRPSLTVAAYCLRHQQHIFVHADAKLEETSMADSDITIEVLKDIRGELRGIRGEVRDIRGEQAETNRRLAVMEQQLRLVDERVKLGNERLEIGNQRLDVIESTLLTLARRQRTTIRLVRGLETRVSKLEAR
jgi:hypothetical protein